MNHIHAAGAHRWPGKAVLQTLTVFASLLVSASVFAQSTKSFLETIDLSKASDPKVVYDRVKSHASKGGNYLSLGESHLEGETAHPIAHKLARLFTDKTSRGFHFCSETIFEFLNSSYGKDLRKKTNMFQLFKGNTPNKTDFADCNWADNTNALVYSGFFHQYRFARAWPADFPETPVTTNPGNNIQDQIKNRNGLFISQIELVWLQTLASRNVMLSARGDAKAFRERATTLISQVDQIKSQMGLLQGQKNQPLKNKFGMYLDKNSFNVDVPMDSKSWFLLTARGINRQEQQLNMLRLLLKESDDRLGRFLTNLHGPIKPHIMGGFSGPTEGGKRVQLQYFGLNVDGEADIIEFNGSVIVADYNKDNLECFQIDTVKMETARPISCDQFF